MSLLTGFAKCRCGWTSETVGGVIELPSRQPLNMRSMFDKIKEDTRKYAEKHNEETGHDARVFFVS